MSESTPLIQKQDDATVSIECQSATTSSRSTSNGSNYKSNISTEKNDNNSNNRQTYLNIMKLCIGSGTLAMPYAAKEGGFLFHMIGLVLITKWNLYSVERMLSSQRLLREISSRSLKNATWNSSATSEISRDSTMRRSVMFEKEQKSTFSHIAHQTFGSFGVHMVDFAMIILMVGIILAYEDAILGFIKDTPLTTGSDRWDALFMLVFIIPVLMLPSYDSIAKISALGTGIVCSVFVIIATWGMFDNTLDTDKRSDIETVSTSVHLWPQSVYSLSHWFGIAVFGYGLVPFAFSIQESMVQPKDFQKVCSISLWTVFGIYCLMGNLIYIIYRQEDIEADVLSLLPNHGITPTLLRLLMTVMILTTLPLIIIPAGSLVHEKLIHLREVVLQKWGRDCSSKNDTKSMTLGIFAVRFVLAITCAIISIELPSFVFVISFIGCLCVSFIGFVYPPLVHFLCMYRMMKLQIEQEIFHHDHAHTECIQSMTVDMIMLIWGILVTVYTSVETYESISQ